MRWIFLCVLFAFFACGDANNAPDVSAIKMDVSIRRFDQDFFALDTTNVQASLQTIERKYPAFLPTYFKYFAPVREIAVNGGLSFDSALVEYYRFIKPLAVDANKAFTYSKDVEEELASNLRYVKHYFPSFKQPVVLTSVESLNPQNPTELFGTTYFNDTLVISLQMFLGKDYPAYDPSQYPEYIRRRFIPAFMMPNCIRSVAAGLYADSSQGSSLIEQMIEKGKQWWLLKKLAPATTDSLVTGYTAAQTEALKREEGNIWGLIAQNENLFSMEQSAVQSYIGEAPFSPTLPQGAPGNIGPWIGWQIIQKFEAENPKLSVQQVLRTPAKKIFAEAKYKPK